MRRKAHAQREQRRRPKSRRPTAQHPAAQAAEQRRLEEALAVVHDQVPPGTPIFTIVASGCCDSLYAVYQFVDERPREAELICPTCERTGGMRIDETMAGRAEPTRTIEERLIAGGLAPHNNYSRRGSFQWLCDRESEIRSGQRSLFQDAKPPPKPELHRERAFESPGPKPSHLWCLHCERAYAYGDYRWAHGLQMCPYADCDGDTVIDAWPWQKILDGHAKYPAVPKHGERYPLYE